MQYINQHSFTITASVALLILSIVLFRDGFRGSDLVPLGALGLGLGLAYLLLGPRASTHSSIREVQGAIGEGTAVLLEYQSPY
jgi:uncharacterized membrane protein